MGRAARQPRLRFSRVLALTLVLAAFVSGSAASQTTGSGSDFRISAGTSIRLDGQGPSVFGDTIGLDFRGGILRAAWADNSGSVDLDLATAAIGVAGDGSISVGPTVSVRAAADQTGAALAMDPSVAGRVLAVARSGDLFGTSSGILRARSIDGGSTWVSAIEPVGVPDSEVSADLACDGFGNCFLAFVDASNPFEPQLRLALSTNGGQSFSPVGLPDVAGFEGDVSVAAGAGSVWLAFTGFDTAPRLRTLAAPVTGLGAVGTFSRQDVPRTTFGNKPEIAVGPGGKALVVTQHLSNGTLSFVEAGVDPDGLGPAGFGAPVRVATVGDYPFQPMPQAAWDRARDRAYIVYRGDQLIASEHGAGAVLLRSSSDSGLSWSASVRVNTDVPSEDRLVPNVAVDSATGNVASPGTTSAPATAGQSCSGVSWRRSSRRPRALLPRRRTCARRLFPARGSTSAGRTGAVTRPASRSSGRPAAFRRGRSASGRTRRPSRTPGSPRTRRSPTSCAPSTESASRSPRTRRARRPSTRRRPLRRASSRRRWAPTGSTSTGVLPTIRTATRSSARSTTSAGPRSGNKRPRPRKRRSSDSLRRRRTPSGYARSTRAETGPSRT